MNINRRWWRFDWFGFNRNGGWVRILQLRYTKQRRLFLFVSTWARPRIYTDAALAPR